jgi:hypothetical protein
LLEAVSKIKTGHAELVSASYIILVLSKIDPEINSG